MRGRPQGSPNRDKPFRAALQLEIAALQAKNDRAGMRAVARALIARAKEGDVQAIREIADRTDGKVPMAVGGSDELPAIGVIVTGVVRAGDEDRSAELTYQDSDKLSDDSGD